MPERHDARVVELLLDPGNARLKREAATPQETIHALVRLPPTGWLLRLAEDIVEHGVDPLALVGVIPSTQVAGGGAGRYLVLEGNRRIAALKALETPELVAAVLSAAARRRLAHLSTRFGQRRVEVVPCVLFDTEAEADHWIRLRHTGENKGTGLLGWGSEEQDRYLARHKGSRSPAGQLLEFVSARADTHDEDAPARRRGVITNLERLLKTEGVRRKLGLQVIDGRVTSWYPDAETLRVLRHVVEDLASRRTKVKDIYTREQRERYARELPKAVLPNPKLRRAAPQPLGSDEPAALVSRGHRPRHAPIPRERNKLIPRGCVLQIGNVRISAMYEELRSHLNIDECPNACAVALRVFVELSVDHYSDAHRIPRGDSNSKPIPLSKRLETVAQHMREKDQITVEIEKAVQQLADGTGPLAPIVMTFNQYVHNKHVHPRPAELRATWDQLQPFMEKLWG